MTKIFGGNMGIDRRRFLLSTAAAGAGLVAGPALRRAHAQTRPDKITFVGVFVGWRSTMEEEVGPAFEKETGIKVDFTFLPIDALSARLKAEFNSGASGIDVVQFSSDFANWTAPHVEDATRLITEFGGDDADYDWNDVFPTAKSAFTVGGKLTAIPYRYITWILHYQPELLEKAGLSKPPETFAEVQDAAIKLTQADGSRYGLGIYGKNANSLVGGWEPYLFSNGGGFYDPKTWDIHINKPESVEALQWYGDLVTKHKVTPPEATTWEWDGLTAGGQTDRYGMTVTIAPYGTFLDDPKVSKTAGKWAWSKVPGGKSIEQSKAQAGGWSLGVPSASANQEWAFEFIKFATSKQWLTRSAERGNCPPRASVLNDPKITELLKWAPVSSEQASTAVPMPDPNDPMYSTLELQLRTGISNVILGNANAQEACDQIAADWQRSLRRANLLK
jgi:multiple sugar transport system substrate-binding protein